MTVYPPRGDLVLFGVSIYAGPNYDILDVKFDSRLTFEDHGRGIASRVSQRIGILRLVKRVFVNTFVSTKWSVHIPREASTLLERQVYSVARLCPDQIFLALCHRRLVAALCMLYKVNSNSNHCLFCEIPGICFYQSSTLPSCGCSSSIRAWSIKV